MNKLLIVSVSLSLVACGQDTGQVGSSGGGGALPYTPQGCGYTVSAPEAAEASLGSDKFGAAPDPTHIHVSWAGPTDSTFAVNWATGLDTMASSILVGTDQAAVSAADGAADGVTLQHGHTIKFAGTSLYQDQQTRVHEAHVCGLTADTTYYYKVGGPGHWSAVYNVATAPTAGTAKPFTFVVTGDSRNEPSVWAAIQQKVQAEAPDFQIFSGDAVNIGANQTEWDDLFAASTTDFKTADYLPTVPFMPVNGNHDNLTVNYIAQFALPQDVSDGEGAQGEEWYSFDYANAHFVMLNDTAASGATVAKQADWMKADLGAVDRGKTPWIFVVHHKPTYSSANHGSQLDLRAAWQPVFDQFKVDIVFNGHDHDYERTQPIRGFQGDGTSGQVASGSGTNGAPVGENGTVYVVAAGAGAPLYSVDGDYFTQVSEKVRNYVVVQIDDKKLSFTAKRDDGSTLDNFSVQK